MPRVTRSPRNSVNDRPGRLKLLLRRQRRLLRPAGWIAFAGGVVLFGFIVVHSAAPGGTLATLRERIGGATAFAGLRVTDVVIEGRANTPEPLLRAALGVSIGDPILAFSVEMARQRIETLTWVEHATVERRLPGVVVVFLQERRPFAVWQNQGKFVLIDRAGQRRWNLRLNNGADVMLPEGHEVEALDRLIQLQQEHAVLDRPLAAIDMRLGDRLVLRPKPDEKRPT
jgi:cell division protein FtsQ